MSKALEVKKENPMATAQMMNDWGVEILSPKDIVIPQILTIQSSSKAAQAGKAVMGEFRDSVSNTLMGKIDAPYECIPFFLQKVWDLYDKITGKWAKTIPVVSNPQAKDYNDNWSMEQEYDGKIYKVVKRFNFFCLLPSELEKNPNALPYFISFKSTSFREGRKLATQMYVKNISEGKPPFRFSIKLSGTRTQNDKGTFIVPNYELGREITPEEYGICMKWIGTMKGGGVKLDESEVTGDAAVEVEAEF